MSAPRVSRPEIALLAALAFFLPLFEVPKQLLWLGWALLSLGMMRRGRESVGLWAVGFLALVAAAVLAGVGAPRADPPASSGGLRQALAPVFAWGPVQALAGAGDTIRLVGVVWLMACRGYRPADCLPVLGAAALGTVLATLWGFWRVHTADTPVFLELHSVGHVNHSSIYLAIALGIPVGALFAGRLHPGAMPSRGHSWIDAWRIAALLAALLIAVALLAAASRAAVGATLLFVLLLGAAAPFPLAQDRRRRWRLRGALLLLATAAVAAYLAASGLSDRRLQPPGQSLLEKFGFQAGQGAPASHRDGLARLALAAARVHPVFGVGAGGFRGLDAARYCAELAPASTRTSSAGPASGPAPARPVAGQSPDCDIGGLFFAPHAHSLYMNTLAERGLVGLLAVLALLIAWGALLRRTLVWARGSPTNAVIWCFALAGWSITALAGLLNTTWHHEHGLLAMLSLGMLLAGSRSGGISAGGTRETS